MVVLRLLLALALLQISGCGETISVASDADDSSKLQTHAPLSSPGWVLDGTDMISLTEMNLAPLPLHPEGFYRAEQGGAEVKVSIISLGDGLWDVVREHREPGLPPHSKAYRVTGNDRQMVSSGNDLKIQGTAEGIVMLELNSGIESIPADFWMHYIRSGNGN